MTPIDLRFEGELLWWAKATTKGDHPSHGRGIWLDELEIDQATVDSEVETYEFISTQVHV